MAAGYEVVAAGPEHLEAVTSLYAETAEWHVSLDPGYYVPFDNTTAAAVGELYDKVLRDTTGEAGVHIARPLGSNAHSEAAVGFVLWSIERGGYHDTHFQDVGVIEEVYVQPSSRRGAASAVGADPCRRGAAGVGTALMEAAMEAMRTRGVEDFKLQASTGNTGAIGFYKRLGWRPRQLLMYHSDSKQPPAAPAVPESSHEQISLQVTLSVRCGQVEAFRDLTKEMVQLSASEPGTLVYERFMSKDEETVHAFERYANSEAAIAHLDMIADRFGDRLIECAAHQHVIVYGNPTSELCVKLDAMPPAGGCTSTHDGAQQHVGGSTYLNWVGGFSRL